MMHQGSEYMIETYWNHFYCVKQATGTVLQAHQLCQCVLRLRSSPAVSWVTSIPGPRPGIPRRRWPWWPLVCCYPLVICYIAIEDGHLELIYIVKKWWFSSSQIVSLPGRVDQDFHVGFMAIIAINQSPVELLRFVWNWVNLPKMIELISPIWRNLFSFSIIGKCR